MTAVRLPAAFCALALASATAAAQAETITITTVDCAQLAEHRPLPDVEYRPGEDVRGRKVAPADLAGSTADIALPEFVHIPITVDLAARYGIPANSVLFKAEAYVGSAKVSLRDGRAWFNGKPLASEEQRALAALCQQVKREGEGR